MKFNLLNIKHFAEEADNNGVFGSAQLSDNNTGVVTSDYNSIASLQAFKDGWNSATLTSKRLPPLEEMQGLESYLSYLINYLYQQGIPEWSSTQTYFKTSFVKTVVDDKPRVWYSLIDNNTNLDPISNSQAWKEFSSGGGGGEIGDIGFAPFGIDETLNLRRYLNGQVISQSLSPSFTAKVKEAALLHPSIITSESNWQSEKTLSVFGQCGKFVIDDNVGTIRLPLVINPQGLTDLALMGTIKSESLPNITGVVGFSDARTNYISGAFTARSIGNLNSAYTGISAQYVADFDASRSSSTYQDSAPVQQEAIQYPYYIQVATGIEETLPAIREYKVNNSDFFGKSMYSDVAPDNASYLASNGQYNARAVYPDYYDWLVSHIGETITANGGKVVLSTGTITDYDFVVNQNDQTFRLPLLNGERVLVKKYVNGTDWYNLYSDGWLEQGGYLSSVPAGVTGSAVTFLKPFSNTNYFSLPSWGAAVYAAFGVSGRTTSGMTVFNRSNETTYCYWKVCGYSPIPTQSDFTEISGLYYYVGDTVQDASLINAGAVLGQLSDKISRTATSDKELVIGWGMPDYSAGVALSSSTLTTITTKGWINYTSIRTNAIGGVTVSGVLFQSGSSATNDRGSMMIPVDVGDTVQGVSGGSDTVTFYPCKGV